jgi:hypothetical protein
MANPTRLCPPSSLCLLVYKPYELVRYITNKTICYWSYVHQLSYLRGTTLHVFGSIDWFEEKTAETTDFEAWHIYIYICLPRVAKGNGEHKDISNQKREVEWNSFLSSPDQYTFHDSLRNISTFPDYQKQWLVSWCGILGNVTTPNLTFGAFYLTMSGIFGPLFF